MLLLFKAVGMGEAAPSDHDAIARWFWAMGFNESLRGKPDHYVVRAVENWQTLIRGGIRGLEPRLKLTEMDLLERRLVRGGALSATFTAMHAVNEARRLTDGYTIDPSVYMKSLDASWFIPIFSRAEIISAVSSETVSARIFANVLLVDETGGRRGDLMPRDAILAAAERQDWQALSSQFINQAAVDMLLKQDVIEFMLIRSELMHARASRLVEERA